MRPEIGYNGHMRIVLIVIVALLLAGCGRLGDAQWKNRNASNPSTTTTTINTSRESLRIKPTSEMKSFYTAIRRAERVIFIENPDEAVPERELVPLSVYDITERRYWEVTKAVTSASIKEANKRGKPGEIYVLRWYRDGYRKLGELRINSATGEVAITYPLMKNGDRGILEEKLYLSSKDNNLINEAAKINRRDENNGKSRRKSPVGTVI
jgi:hypothetical protein